MSGDALAALEAAYLDARDARDRLDVARATGEPADPSALERASRAARSFVEAALASLPADDEVRLAPGDARALAAIRHGIATVLADDAVLPVPAAVADAACADAAAWAAAMEAGGTVLRERLEACYASAAAAIPVGGELLSRLQVLARLAREPNRRRRRSLFLALEPVWRAVDGDGGAGSPYRALVRESAAAWREGRSPVEANARALGLRAPDIEAWAVATLEAWRAVVVAPALAAGGAPIEPWDWWWTAGIDERALRAVLPLDRIHALNAETYASLGADLDALGVCGHTTPHAGRPPLPVAFTTFGERPRRRPDGTWSPGAPTILATYVDGGLGELVELVHETGHAVHIAGIRTRPAFADWPDSDALTEALAELVALDVAEPAWRRRRVPDAPEVPEALALRGRYADVVLDAAWALFEIRLHADPDRSPNDAWTEITSDYLGIAPHPEWSWWALRGQLVGEPGYLANYAVGAVLVTELRAAVRDARGDWTEGDPGWYAWVRDRVYRFGLERPSGEVVRDVLGRAPRVDALVAEIERSRA